VPSPTFRTPDRTLNELGFEAVIAALADRTQTTRGRELAVARPFLADEAEVHLSLVRIEQARAVLSEEKVVPVGGADDVRALAGRASKGAMLSGEELVSCGRLMRAAMAVRAFLRARRETQPELAEMGVGLPDLGALAARIEFTLEPSGMVRDEASETLAAHRRRARGLHAEARRRIETMLADPDFTYFLQDKYFSVRSDRYVLPVNASFRSKVPGIVHNASQTGLTLFVEPQVLVDLGNELAIAESLALEEERRILTELSESVGDRAAELERAVELVGELDVVQAAARLADSMKAWPAELVTGTADIELRRMRHPVLVLQGKKVVANDVLLRSPAASLVVSGPNAGGKTVSITGVGLCALMTRAGLPIPAGEGSRVPLLAGVASIIGDAQDLGKDLSTFSAHLTAVRDALATASAGWLVVIDEIAADTDPTQGAALARAILEELVTRGSRVLVTTHLDEVKALGLTDERFANARVGLDPATLAPTYQLELGAAGGSSAVEMAARVGLPASVLARAREYLKGEGLLSAALGRLEVKERATEEQRQALTAERDELTRSRAEAERLRGDLARARLEVERTVRAELEGELERRRHEVSRLIAELQARPDMSAAQKAQHRIDELATDAARERAVADAAAQAASGEVHAPAPATVAPGVWVKVVQLGQEGRVVSVEGKTATVEVGALRTRARIADLVTLPGRTGKARERSRPADAVVAAPLALTEARCDVRGLRADEAMSVIERFLDDHYLSGPSTVIIVHGHGTGALKQLVREALEKSPYVDKFRPGDRHEGGDGATVVQLSS